MKKQRNDSNNEQEFQQKNNKVSGEEPIEIKKEKIKGLFLLISQVIAGIGLIIAAIINVYPVIQSIQTTQTPSPKSSIDVDIGKELRNPSLSPTLTEIVIIPSETPILDLDHDCIDSNIWTPYMGEMHTVDDYGCWNLKDWGFQVENGILVIKSFSSQNLVNRGIYRSIDPYVDISFDMRIIEMETIDDLEPKLMFGIMPPTIRAIDVGKYIYYQKESVSQHDLYVKLIDGTLERGRYLPIRYQLGEMHRLNLIIRAFEMSAFINGNKILNKIRLPFEVKYFWLGYELPGGTSIYAEIANISVISK